MNITLKIMGWGGGWSGLDFIDIRTNAFYFRYPKLSSKEISSSSIPSPSSLSSTSRSEQKLAYPNLVIAKPLSPPSPESSQSPDQQVETGQQDDPDEPQGDVDEPPGDDDEDDFDLDDLPTPVFAA